MPTFRSAAGNQTGATTTLVISKPAGVLTGDVLLAFVFNNDNTSTITPPTGWTEVLQDGISDPTTFNCRGEASWHVVAAGDPASWTWTQLNAVGFVGSILAYSGANGAAPINVSGDTPAGNTTTITAPSITTTVSGCTLVCSFGDNNSSETFTLDASLTQRDLQNGAVASVSEIDGDVALGAAGATTAKTTTITTANTTVGIALALAPSVSTIPQRTLLGVGI